MPQHQFNRWVNDHLCVVSELSYLGNGRWLLWLSRNYSISEFRGTRQQVIARLRLAFN